MQKREPSLILAISPVVAAVTFILIAQVITDLGCRGSQGNCGYDWLWLFLWPAFFVLLAAAVVTMLVLLLLRYKN